MRWIDAKCNECGLQREVVLFVEPTKPRDPLRCPRCESLNVTEVKPEAERQRRLDAASGIPDYMGVDVCGMTAGQREAVEAGYEACRKCGAVHETNTGPWPRLGSNTLCPSCWNKRVGL